MIQSQEEIMFLKSIHLKNIRSYVDERIEFSLGALLIEGDIGSGKSTILLAIDFALFGARANELPASSLLRTGTNRGEVVLEFTVDGKEVEIKRVLEKKGASVTQTAGYITINGTRKDLMSMGLKSLVFELLGYPKADIKAGKSMIYRYTVYTPQEQMKQIMLQKPDDRLNTIRAIFNIDKYKRIRENAKAIVRELKKKSSHLDGIAYDLALKQEKRAELAKQGEALCDEEKKKESVYVKIKENLEGKKEEKVRVQEALKKLNALVHEKNVEKARLENEEKMLLHINEEIKDTEKKLGQMKSEEECGKNIAEIEKGIPEKEALLKREKELDEEIKHVRAKLTETDTRKSTCEETMKNIIGLSECPTCRQTVSSEYKEDIRQKEEDKIEKFRKILVLHTNSLEGLKEELKDVKQKQDVIVENEKVLIRVKAELASLKDAKESIFKKMQRQGECGTSIDALKKSIELFDKEIEPLADTEEVYVKVEKEVDILNGEHTVSLAQFEKVKLQLSGIDKEKVALDKEIDEKIKAKKESESLREITNWLNEYFVALMETMEKHIMLSVLRDFDMLFREWFNILMDDDSLQARIDMGFTPVIEQNSYETSYDFLSGGEKTSIALAYRLALNKVINDMCEDIKTKSLLILDEPTDGFSSEQLDKVRDVLLELKLGQTIIVSHEEKIESFVDKTIRVVKKDHVSQVII